MFKDFLKQNNFDICESTSYVEPIKYQMMSHFEYVHTKYNNKY